MSADDNIAPASQPDAQPMPDTAREIFPVVFYDKDSESPSDLDFRPRDVEAMPSDPKGLSVVESVDFLQELEDETTSNPVTPATPVSVVKGSGTPPPVVPSMQPS